jgi:hypothetical protein
MVSRAAWLFGSTPSFATSTRVCARAYWGLTPAELFPPPALNCGYPRTPLLRPRSGRAAAMKLASVFSGFNGHAARLTLSRASATSRPPLPAKCHGVLLANLVLAPLVGYPPPLERHEGPIDCLDCFDQLRPLAVGQKLGTLGDVTKGRRAKPLT